MLFQGGPVQGDSGREVPGYRIVRWSLIWAECGEGEVDVRM